MENSIAKLALVCHVSMSLRHQLVELHRVRPSSELPVSSNTMADLQGASRVASSQ